MTVATDAPVRCSAWAREVELSPAGSIGSQDGFLLVETPLPWPHDVGDLPALAALAPLIKPHRIRLQAVLDPDASGPRRVVLHRTDRAEGWFHGYRRYEATAASESELPAAVEAVLAQSASGQEASDDLDLLVCTHGRRDVCCGSSGTTLSLDLAADDTVLPPRGRLWRTSHTGGHRYAPTFLVLPQGTAWAFAEAAVVKQVLARSVPFAQLAGHYRGCAGLGSPQLQVLERDVLRLEGWELLDRPRRGYVEGDRAVLEVGRPDGGVDRWDARVAPGRTVPVPDCGKPLADARKSATEWELTDLQRR